MNKRYTLNELSEVANQIVESASNKVLLFYGEMGVGKTTLIKEIFKQLSVEDVVSSPTFSLVNEYLSRQGETIYHFDFYRIKNEEEALDMGIEEYFDSNNWCLVEWPDNIKNLLPLNAVKIKLLLNEDGSRRIEVENEKEI
ncbi:tRNA (adenosine(37)-N6)-threonylcarbamoyltransferase complex ATPase subunit type 1 TsaE [Aureibaculum sp. 2210JD6-5]|uniref:tRNA (adenosine(37)-N6)-threonylcarbamoyltransferase complex ATPase subunit type 1 TsaE n=1 Tax=Aureibaculum sp. 2210JD6-5 TaxID=3103957 RepID=UPI002AACA632|nr:tRNA (adenosine(37)-N6)-threonylcarbamoyltransferase complex ATPase subunit type 1 TsaE [Aureibaculum sp. 2210JD6-5]MDY7394178.1 tRNA (adenosine(37)-N6)-threonylcarbamoyltransferase complex ATPase subunit type 1 TsaE [Aureibaculum sp. 2210JD6-5]